MVLYGMVLQRIVCGVVLLCWQGCLSFLSSVLLGMPNLSHELEFSFITGKKKNSPDKSRKSMGFTTNACENTATPAFGGIASNALIVLD